MQKWPSQTRRHRSRAKDTATGVWEWGGILLADFSQGQRTMISADYESVFRTSGRTWAEKCTGTSPESPLNPPRGWMPTLGLLLLPLIRQWRFHESFHGKSLGIYFIELIWLLLISFSLLMLNTSVKSTHFSSVNNVRNTALAWLDSQKSSGVFRDGLHGW